MTALFNTIQTNCSTWFDGAQGYFTSLPIEEHFEFGTHISAVSEEKLWQSPVGNSPYLCRDRGLNQGLPKHTLTQAYFAQVLQLMYWANVAGVNSEYLHNVTLWYCHPLSTTTRWLSSSSWITPFSLGKLNHFWRTLEEFANDNV